MDTKSEQLAPIAYSPDDIARATHGAISVRRVYDALTEGTLVAKKIGRRTVITADELKRYLDSFPDRDRKPGRRTKAKRAAESTQQQKDAAA